MATACAFKQMMNPQYKEFVNQSLKDFVDNDRKYKKYESPALNAQQYAVTIKKAKDGKFIIYDKDDIMPS